jgi:hypothetical protein
MRSDGQHFKRLFLTLSFAAVLQGCNGKGPQSQDAKPPKSDLIQAEAIKMEALVKSDLKDPDSARFRNIRRVYMPTPKEVSTADPTTLAYCGEVNARNSFGGYTGFQPFAVAVGKNPMVEIWERSSDTPPLTYLVYCSKDQKTFSSEPVSPPG